MTTPVLTAGPARMSGDRIAGHLPGQPDVAGRLLLRACAVKYPLARLRWPMGHYLRPAGCRDA